MAASLRPGLYFLFRHCLLLTILHRSHSETLETITSTVPLHDGDVILSENKNFALGFFSPGNSTRRYLGTWYNKISEKTVFWVANRDFPINDTSGILSIDSNGSLMLNCCNNKTSSVWFADIPNMVSSNGTIAQLDDMGNFILVETLSSRVLWQSFDHPTDTIMPFMKLGWANGIDRILTSWKSTDDPGVGNYTHGIDLTGYPQTFLNKSGVPYWRGGPWTGQRWSGVPAMANPYIFNVSFVNNQDEVSIEFGLKDRSILTRKVLEPSGLLQTSTWNTRSGRWIQYWAVPVEQCDFYGTCGPNSNCNPYNTDQFACTCLPGFEPKSPADWFLRDGSGGCVRSNATSTCQNGEGFVMVARVKAPDTSRSRANMNMSLKECEQACLKNCTCTAYMAADESSEFGCLAWYGDLLDTRTFSDIGQDLYVRVDASTLAQYASPKGSPAKWVIGASASVTAVMLLLLSIFLLKIRKRRGRLKSFVTPIAAYFWDDESNNKHDLDGETGKQDSPLFDLDTISVATDNFSFANKLGEGGFGSVYKGVLDDGKEIAVKRLSKSSGQGLEEFKNEVAVIAKLQHRNLVKTLGCCIEGDEKMLIYEYMPNKSLDAFLFDEEKKSLLDWRKRFEIATGIARGILYLHQDSTLRIIHRDLKTTNVLLDSSMCPKISDFGMARICGGDQVEGFTRRVVGTYGYMSPEYAMRGLFSVKSDVYSFGIVLLEIISGKRNSSFHQDNSSIHLIDHVWKIWKEGWCFDIVDPSMLHMYPENEVLRCIQIGLLCVQEFPMDRPTMSSVVFMLENNGNLPIPKKPAFTLQRMMPDRLDTSLSNDMSFTVVEAR